MKWYSDPSHAWLAVSLKQYPEAIKYSTGFGYISPSGGTVYLEEDCEAPCFLSAKGIDSMSLPEKVYGKSRAPLTNYEHAPRLADYQRKDSGVIRLVSVVNDEILFEKNIERVSA
jgi:hypothetical protein